MIRLEFGWAFSSINAYKRMHYHALRKRRNTLAWEVLAQLSGRRPAAPLPFAYIHIDRFSTRGLDEDNRPSCAKHLLDVLQPPSKVFPSGLGVITQDSAKYLRLSVRDVPIKRSEKPRTVVWISGTPLDDWITSGSR